MNALILAAGFGTRLSPLTNIIPKCLVPINGVPLIHYWICDLLHSGIQRILINTHYKSDLVSEFIGEQFYKDNITLVKEEALLGTAGTLIANKSFFGGLDFLVAHGDNYTDINLKKLINFHLSFRPEIQFTLTTFRSSNPAQCGIITSENGVVTSFIEKPLSPKSNLSNCAIYVCGPNFFEKLKSDVELKDISIDLIPSYTEEIKCFHHSGFNLDIGTHENFFQAQNKTYKKNYETCQFGSLKGHYKRFFELLDKEFEGQKYV